MGFSHHCKELVKRERTSGLRAAPGRVLGGGEIPEKAEVAGSLSFHVTQKL